MFKQALNIILVIFKFLGFILVPVGVLALIFALLCLTWFLVFKFYFKLEYQPSGIVPVKKSSIWKQLFYEVPKRYVQDLYAREPGFFQPKGIHMILTK